MTNTTCYTVHSLDEYDSVMTNMIRANLIACSLLSVIKAMYVIRVYRTLSTTIPLKYRGDAIPRWYKDRMTDIYAQYTVWPWSVRIVWVLWQTGQSLWWLLLASHQMHADATWHVVWLVVVAFWLPEFAGLWSVGWANAFYGHISQQSGVKLTGALRTKVYEMYIICLCSVFVGVVVAIILEHVLRCDRSRVFLFSYYIVIAVVFFANGINNMVSDIWLEAKMRTEQDK
jgi:hypothetical protein